MTWYVYALCEPVTKEVRYIGKSADPKTRLVAHMSDEASAPMREWMRAIRFKPELKILEERSTEDEALAAEKHLIEEHWSGRLLNSYSRAGMEQSVRKPPRWPGFGDRLRAFRKAKGLTTTQLESMTGIRCGSISNMERRCDCLVTAESAMLLARAMGISVETLITGESP